MAEIKYEKHKAWGNIWSAEQIAAKTDGLDKLMNRCWYAVASNAISPTLESFWEINWWDGAAREGKKVFTNQTITYVSGKEVVSPVWPGHVIGGKPAWTMRMKMGCVMPMGTIAYEWFNFPEDDSFSGFWSVGAVAMGMKIVFVFCLDPHVSKEKVDAEIERLATEHGVNTKKVQKVNWKPEYTPGDTGEFSFNREGKPSLIDHTKNKYARQVLAPYPPPKPWGPEEEMPPPPKPCF